MRAHLLVKSQAGQFIGGAVYPFRGLGLLVRNRKIVLLSLVPFIVSLLVYVALLALVVAFGGRLTDLVIEAGTWWRTIVRVVLRFATIAIFLIVFVFSYSILSLVIAAPFYEFLSAAAERRYTGEVREEPSGWREMLVDVWRGLTEAVKFLVIELGLCIFALACAPASTPVALCLSAVLIGLELMEGPMGRRRMTFRQKMRYARRHFWPLLGFGSVATVALLVPFLGVAFLPVGVVGGTMMFCDIEARSAG